MRMRRKNILLSILWLGAINVFPPHLEAHPGSGIAVDRRGNIYFVDTGGSVWKVDAGGTLSRHPGPAYHWMAIDLDGKLERVSLPSFSQGGAVVTRAGVNPALLLSSDFPIVVSRDGSLVYPWARASNSSGQLQVFRLASPGETSVLATLPENNATPPVRWLNGLAQGPDGWIYFTEDSAVRKISSGGEILTVADHIAGTGCSSIPGIEPQLGPNLRGLCVDTSGNVYVAASGCGSVLMVTPGGIVTTVLRAKSPWSPTGVALHGGDVYVLEYYHTEGDNRREWFPRVRKLSSDGSISLVAEITQR